MTAVRDIIDRVCTAAAHGMLVWTARRLDPVRRPWIEAMRAEIGAIEGGVAQLAWAVWAVGGLRLVYGAGDHEGGGEGV